MAFIKCQYTNDYLLTFQRQISDSSFFHIQKFITNPLLISDEICYDKSTREDQLISLQKTKHRLSDEIQTKNIFYIPKIFHVQKTATTNKDKDVPYG